MRKCGVAGLVESGQPVVQKVSRRSVGDEAYLVAEARQVNNDRAVNRTDVGSVVARRSSLAGIADNDHVNLVWIIRLSLVGRRAGHRPAHDIKNQRESTGGGNDSQQNGRGPQRLTASDIEAGSGEPGEVAGNRLLHRQVFLRFPRGWLGRRISEGFGHTGSVDALPLRRVNTTRPTNSGTRPGRVFLSESLANQQFLNRAVRLIHRLVGKGSRPCV